MTNKHTPGGWRITTDYSNAKDCLDIWTNEGSGSLMVAEVRSKNINDARLIAAAPDLYDAATAARFYLCDENRRADDLLPVIEVLQAAIAKARGEA